MKRLVLIFLLCAAALLSQTAGDDRAELLRKMDARAQHFGDLSRQIWEFAEVGYKETRSSALLKSELRSAGFRIQENIAGIPTAFIAGWGEGRPVIPILGEYDALPGLSQEDIPEKKARVQEAQATVAGIIFSEWHPPLRPSP